MDSNDARQPPLQEIKQEASQQQVIQQEASLVVSKQDHLSKILVVLLVIIIAAGICGVIVYTNHKPIKVNQNTSEINVPNNSFSILPTTQPTHTPTIHSTKTPPQSSFLSTYTNTHYGFQLRYPIQGFVLSSADSYAVGPCGQHIKIDNNVNGSSIDEIAIDNFFGISIDDFTGTLDDYINRNYPKTRFNYIYTPIQDSNADEAVSVNMPPNALKQPGPLAIYRKNTKIFTLFTFQNQGTLNACVLADSSTFQSDQWPGISNQVYTNTYNTYYKNWSIPQSFTFMR